MMRFTLTEMAAIAQGRVVGENVAVCGMIHDTRQLEAGQLFCALPGEQHDGHAFLEQARKAGAAAALVSRETGASLPQLLVDHVPCAMARLARAWREKLDLLLVGITGSNGKTTVKEMLAAILASQGPVLATRGNYNNELGVPLTLARLDVSHHHAVVEMGANQPGDIASLAEMARPDIGVVTNAGPAHLEGFGSIEGVARAKGELFSALPKEGTAVINADDAFAPLWRELAGDRRIISFGMSGAANVSGVLSRGTGLVNTPAGDFRFEPRLPGRHNFCNALAATAVAVGLEVPVSVIAESLSTIEPVPGRLQLYQHPQGWQLVDDSYNANPASLLAALQVLAEMDGDERWLVLGDMGELGPDGERLHAETASTAHDLGISRLFTIGELAAVSADAFKGDARHFSTRKALLEALAEQIRPGVVCLIKGSRSMGMERVVQQLLEGESVC